MYYYIIILIIYFNFINSSEINSKEEEIPQNSLQSTNNNNNCFNKFPQKAFSNADPLAEFYNSSPKDCLRFCFKISKCHSIVFHKNFSNCQLYTKIIGNEAKEVFAKGHDIYIKNEDCNNKFNFDKIEEDN